MRLRSKINSETVPEISSFEFKNSLYIKSNHCKKVQLVRLQVQTAGQIITIIEQCCNIIVKIK